LRKGRGEVGEAAERGEHESVRGPEWSESKTVEGGGGRVKEGRERRREN
jgi:hypothetical protein